jgi:hypothetical protein
MHLRSEQKVWLSQNAVADQNVYDDALEGCLTSSFEGRIIPVPGASGGTKHRIGYPIAF